MKYRTGKIARLSKDLRFRIRSKSHFRPGPRRRFRPISTQFDQFRPKKNFGPPPGKNYPTAGDARLAPSCTKLQHLAHRLLLQPSSPTLSSNFIAPVRFLHSSFVIRSLVPAALDSRPSTLDTARKMVQYHFSATPNPRGSSLRLCSLRYLLFTIRKTEQNRTKREGGLKIERCASTIYNNQNRTSFSFPPRTFVGHFVVHFIDPVRLLRLVPDARLSTPPQKWYFSRRNPPGQNETIGH